jgi:hypothetical protein
MILAIPGRLESQESLSALQGVVRNESGHPVEQAQVLLYTSASARELRTDRDGRFRFIGVPAGPNRLRVLRIGFQPHDTTITVGGTNTEVEIRLQRLTTLKEVEVVTRRTGVYGTVLGRDSLQALEGARVELLGAREGDTTDATGAFAMPTDRVGTFMLRVSRRGYDTRMVSVRVPKDTGVGLDIVLSPGLNADQHMEMLWADMAQRIHWKGVNSAFVGHEELTGRGSSLDMAIRFAPSYAKRTLVIDERACVFVNGLARPFATIKDFSVDEIESIEVYGSRSELTNTLGKRWPRGAICGNPNARIVPGNRAQLISIWTRR